jgi:protein gp37
LIGPLGPVDLTGIDWVISGGESGPGARRCLAPWVREVRDLCQRYGVRHFFKQWGTVESNPLFAIAPDPRRARQWVAERDPIGKGGSLLDGVAWKEMPEGFSVAAYGPGEEYAEGVELDGGGGPPAQGDLFGGR